MSQRHLDRYLLGEPIGSGGMAVVYQGRDTLLNREVAIKVMHPHLASREESRKRFSREAQAVARLKHPGILEIFDFSGDGSEESYIVTELVKGRTLRAFGEEIGFPLPEIAALVAASLCEALDHAHAQGVIHRDLKPENVMVREDGVLKLMDFGIARMSGNDDRMTLTGALMGSPHHMAPEIIEGKEAGPASDLFALGTILYWMVTGKMAFEGNNPTHSLRQILESDYLDPRLLCPSCPTTLAEAISRCLRKDPKDRFASAGELRDAILAPLVEVGIERPREELQAFFRDPTPYAASLRGRIRERLLSLAGEALRHRRPARALSCLDRLLCMDPEDGEARALLERVQAVGRRKKWILRGGGAALAGALVWGVVLALPSPPPVLPEEDAPIPQVAEVGPPLEEAEEKPPSPPLAPPSRQESPRPREVIAPKPQETPAPRQKEEEAASKETREVHLRWVPQGAVLYLDGKRMETVAPAWTGSLPVGSHRFALMHSACCQPFEEEMEIEAGDEPIRRSIALLPKESGWFEVDCEEPAAEVWLDGSFRGTVAEIQQRGGVAVAFSRNDSGRQRYVKTVRFDLLPPKGAEWLPVQGEVVVRSGQRTRSDKLACAEAANR